MKRRYPHGTISPMVQTLVSGKISQKDAEYVWSTTLRACRQSGLPGLPLLLRIRFVTHSLGESKAAGEYVGRAKFNGKIDLSARHWRKSPRRERRRLLIHEIAHVAEFLVYGTVTYHGRGFRTMMRRLGCKPDATDLVEAT